MNEAEAESHLHNRLRGALRSLEQARADLVVEREKARCGQLLADLLQRGYLVEVAVVQGSDPMRLRVKARNFLLNKETTVSPSISIGNPNEEAGVSIDPLVASALRSALNAVLREITKEEDKKA